MNAMSPAVAASRAGPGFARVTRRLALLLAVTLAWVVWALGTTPAAAVGLGAITQQSALGQPLRVVVPLTSDPGEDLAAECFKLTSPDRGADGIPQLVFGRVSLERTPSGAQLVVTHPRPVNDPIVRLTLQAGCDAAVLREYTLLMDLPPIDVPLVTADSATLGDVAAPSPPPVGRAPARAARAATAGSADAPQGARRAPSRPRAAARGSSQRSPPGAAGQPRLKLSSAPPPVPGAVARPGTEPPQAQSEQELANAIEAETVVLRQRIAELSAMVERLQQEVRASEIVERSPAEAAKAPPAAPSPPAPLPPAAPAPWWETNWPLLAVIIGMPLLIAGGLLWKRRQDASARGADWQATGVGPTRTDTLTELRNAPAGLVQSGSERGAPTMTKSPPPARYSRDAASALAVSELSQVTEEARVYVALGHPDRAIDVLNEHIKRLPKSMPAAWLMLLDLYHASGRRQEFRRLAEEFHLHFNVQTPLWDGFAVTELDDGGLEAFPHIERQIVGLWGQPACHAYLERLLYDNREGRRTGFPLAAYSDILLLLLISDVPPAIDIDTDLANEGKLGPGQSRAPAMAAMSSANPPSSAEPARPRRPMPPEPASPTGVTPLPLSFELDLGENARRPGKKPS